MTNKKIIQLDEITVAIVKDGGTVIQINQLGWERDSNKYTSVVLTKGELIKLMGELGQ